MSDIHLPALLCRLAFVRVPVKTEIERNRRSVYAHVHYSLYCLIQNTKLIKKQS